MEQYLGIFAMMSIINLPQAWMYRLKETRIPVIADTMPRKQSEELRRFFHCSNNSKTVPASQRDFYKLLKVCPVIVSILKECRRLPQEDMHSIDEQMLTTKR